MQLNWDNIWQGFAMVVLATIFTSIMIYSFAPKHTIRYVLTAGNADGIPHILREVENDADESIILSKEITWSQSIRLVDSLNASLHTYPICK